MAPRVALLSCVVFLLSLISFASKATSEQEECTYIVRVMTGDVKDASTDSTISLKLNSSSGVGLTIDNLKDWGILEPGHHYYQQGQLDVFSGRGPCIGVCAITVISDGRGPGPGWYLDYVEVTIVGCYEATKVAFPVNQWLDPTAGYQLYANVNLCPDSFGYRRTVSSV